MQTTVSTKFVKVYHKNHVSSFRVMQLPILPFPPFSNGLLHRHLEGIRQYDSCGTGQSDNVKIAAEHQEPAEVLSQLGNTSNPPVYGEYKCC